MSFRNKINKQFESFYLKPIKLPRRLNHLYADYIELVALIYNGDYATTSNIIKRYKDEGIKLYKKETQEDNEIGSQKSEIEDKYELWADSIFLILKDRELNFLDHYPFYIDQKGIKLKDNQSVKNKIYLTLLLSSNLNYFSKMQSRLTTEFEEISFQALRNFLPIESVVKQLGENSDYGGTARSKVENLAIDMSISTNNHEVSKIDGTNERGLDVIGWIPFKDKIPNLITILVQCACGDDWYKKQSETKRYENAYYNFYRLPPIHSMFIPYALGKNSSEFYQSDEIDNKLLFERKRILDYIKETEFFYELDSNQLIEYCIGFQEDTV